MKLVEQLKEEKETMVQMVSINVKEVVYFL